jgi:hypothetical protein
MPARSHSAAWLTALVMTMRPISGIKPHFSATGMNSPGAIMPRSAWFQRTSASMPLMAPLASEICGWK